MNIHHQQRRAISPPQVVTPPDSLIPTPDPTPTPERQRLDEQTGGHLYMVWGVLRKWWIYHSNNHRLSQLHASKIFLIAMHHCIIILHLHLAYALQPTLPIQTCLSLVSAKLDVLSMYADWLDHIGFCSQSLVILIPKNWGYSLPVNLLVDQTPCHWFLTVPVRKDDITNIEEGYTVASKACGTGWNLRFRKSGLIIDAKEAVTCRGLQHFAGFSVLEATS
jgi:hypothetical protein